MCPMNNRLHNLSVSKYPATSTQSGFVLVIALIVLAAMTLAAAAMVRTVDTSTMLARNISFKRDAVNRNDFALEAAIDQFRVGGAFVGGSNTSTSDATQNFSAVMLPTDSDGVPLVLKANTSSDTFTGGSLGEAAPTQIPAALKLQMVPVYLIERMCTTTGPAVVETCIVNGRTQAGGTQPNDKPGQLFPPIFRITARVTGPRNTVSYVQAMFSFQNT
jgi:type IV pilus assembly protein PilX